MDDAKLNPLFEEKHSPDPCVDVQFIVFISRVSSRGGNDNGKGASMVVVDRGKGI